METAHPGKKIFLMNTGLAGDGFGACRRVKSLSYFELCSQTGFSAPTVNVWHGYREFLDSAWDKGDCCSQCICGLATVDVFARRAERGGRRLERGRGDARLERAVAKRCEEARR
jgi:hypothetical protein